MHSRIGFVKNTPGCGRVPCAAASFGESVGQMSSPPDRKRLSADALLALFAGLSLASCDKAAPSAPATAEKPVGASSAVQATEVSPAASAPAEGGEKACAPGGCAPGKCGGAPDKK